MFEVTNKCKLVADKQIAYLRCCSNNMVFIGQFLSKI